MKSGLGIRPDLFEAVEQNKPDFGFLEAHSENYFGDSLIRNKLIRLRQDYPISLHGVGLSLGRADDLDTEHLAQLKHLVEQLEPLLVSEHLAWSAYGHQHVPDLLPLPLDDCALALVCEHVDQMQNVLGRSVLIENPANYLLFDQLQIPEPEFLNELAKRTGCGLLLDINNVFVSANNLGRCAQDYINSLDSSLIGQYHLAGHTSLKQEINGAQETLLIDTHDQVVEKEVWKLFETTLQQHGARPTLIEWDTNLPDFSVLVNECALADCYLSAATPIVRKRKAIESSQLSMTSDLAARQTAFLDSVLSLSASLEGVVRAHQHRIRVYQNNVFGAALNYLAAVYPATQGVVGESFFKQMAHKYVQIECPSKGNIHTYGGSFNRVVGVFDSLERTPYLVDLLRYEWALQKAYYATQENILLSHSFSNDQLLRISVRFNQSVTVLDTQYPVFEIHRQSLPDYNGSVSIELAQSQDSFLVFKNNQGVQTVLLDDDAYLFVQAISTHETLLDAISAVHSSIADAAVSETLKMMFEYGVLTHG